MDLKAMYEAVDVAKQTKEDGLFFQSVPFNKATVLLGYSDSSWANAEGHKSQMGTLTLISSPDCMDHISKASVLDWKSGRSPRVTRSTLASEANAMDECVDRTTYANHFLSELLYQDEPREIGARLLQLQVTDCRSLHDIARCCDQ